MLPAPVIRNMVPAATGYVLESSKQVRVLAWFWRPPVWAATVQRSTGKPAPVRDEWTTAASDTAVNAQVTKQAGREREC